MPFKASVQAACTLQKWLVAVYNSAFVLVSPHDQRFLQEASSAARAPIHSSCSADPSLNPCEPSNTNQTSPIQLLSIANMSNAIPSSILAGATTTHFLFLPMAFTLTCSLIYLYFAIPRSSSSQQTRAVILFNQRPSGLLPMLAAASFIGVLSHMLNILYISQSVPQASSGGATFHIPHLTFAPWLVLMTTATTLQYIPTALIISAALLVLQARYRSLLRNVQPAVKDSEWVPGPFLGWIGKEGTSMLLSYLLFILPIASKIALSLGLAWYDSPYFMAAGITAEIADFTSWNRMSEISLALDNCRSVVLALAVFDVTVSAYCLLKETQSYGLMDAVR